MKITGVKTCLGNCFRTNQVFVKIETDSGIHDWGEATFEYKENTVAAAIHANLVAVLASSESSNMTGEIVTCGAGCSRQHMPENMDY